MNREISRPVLGEREGEVPSRHSTVTMARWPEGTRSHWQGARDQSTLWSIASAGAEDAATTHGTQKPVEAMRRPVVNNSERGDLVCEPFCSIGTTFIAAETVGRRCVAMEIDPAYCDVIVRRWQDFTGKAAVLTGEDRVFGDIATARCQAAA